MSQTEKIWENNKNTQSFLNEVARICRENEYEEGDVQVIDTMWGSDPIQVEVNILDDGSGMIDVYPCFFGETLNDLTPATVPFVGLSNKAKP